MDFTLSISRDFAKPPAKMVKLLMIFNREFHCDGPVFPEDAMRIVLLMVGMIVLMTGFASVASAGWISFDNQELAEPQVQASRQSDSITLVDISMSGLEIQEVMIQGQAYDELRIPGHWFTIDAGQPELPFITSTLIIPDSGTPEVRILKSTWREVAAHAVLPSKGTILRTDNPADHPYTFGPVYQSTGVFPQAEVQLNKPYIMRDVRGVSLRINAVRWDVARGVLLVLESMTLEVGTSGTGGINSRQGKMQDSIDTQFANLYSQSFDNYESAAKYNMVSADGRMLVVCHDSFMGIIQPFVEWKRSAGREVQLISTGSVGGTTGGIQGAIDALYAEPAGLTYVILVGDQEQVPSYSGTFEGADDDTRYGNIEGDDLYPDLFVSRISGSNPIDIQTQINKFVRYERDPDAGADWYHIGAALASNLGDPSDLERAGWLREDMLNYTFSEVHEIYQPDGDTADIAAAVNAGVSLINYLGHGTGTSWTNPYFTAADIGALTNGWMTPWILDVSCSNGDFSTDECFAEAWMRAGNPDQPQGALATYSASTTTPWVPPCIMQAEAVDLMVANQANVLGSLYFHGIMKVMDVYPGNSQLVEQYNIFGDCSLMIRTNIPVVPAMEYDDVLALGATTYPVDTGVENARVALYSDGQLHGVGVTDAAGHVDVELTNPVAVPGQVSMTVTGYNLLTQIITLQAEVPVVVDIQPATIPVGETTDITVTLTDSPAAAVLENVTITVEGFGVSAVEGITNASGVAIISVTPEFGEILTVRGVEQGAGYDMFKVDLEVTGALELTNAQITAEVAVIGMSGSLTMDLEGTVTGTTDVADFDLKLMGPGVDLLATGSGYSVVQNVTPLSTGIVYATLLKTGYNTHQSEFPVIPAYGTLAGTVSAATGETLDGVRVYGFHAGDDPSGDPVFDLVSDGTGGYAAAVQLPAGSYDLYTRKFGYLDYSETFTLMHGTNDHPVVMDLSPVGVFSGDITALEGGAAVSATIQVFRLDNNDQMALITTDELGHYTGPELPYYNYRVIVTAYMYEVQAVTVSLDSLVEVMNFQMVDTNGKILVINSNSSREELVVHPPKAGKNGAILAEGYTAPQSRAASDLAADLSILNFTVDLVDSPAYLYDDLFTYDVVIVSAGSSSQNFADALKDDMSNFVAAGGKLLIEGGEVGFNNRLDEEFRTNVLHMITWKSDIVGDLTVRDATHPLMSQPNLIAGPMDLHYTGYGDSDSVIPASDAHWPGSWDNIDTRAGVICYDPNPAPEGGQIVNFTFSYSSLDVAGRADLLHNAVSYLMVQEVGDAMLTGKVLVQGGIDPSGATLILNPGHRTFTTGPDGVFNYYGLVDGLYQLTAQFEGFSTVVLDVEMPEGETVEQDVFLNPIVTNAFCDAADVDIPDNDPAGVYCTISVENESTLSGLRVFVDISHSAETDLEIDLISPSGTALRLHQNQDYEGAGLVGWYPEDLDSAESLDPFLGEPIQGLWQLLVIDQGASDLGHVNSWCLEMSYELMAISPVDDVLVPQVLALEGNYPNPFNPRTMIKFSVPADGQVELAVFDVRGVRVRTLIREVMAAGHHEAHWMGRDDAGRAVASGSYFYRLRSGKDTVVGKMLLMK